MIVHADLLKFGFVINEEKSIWEPVQIITWLGTVLDTNQGLISVTEQRISKLKANIDSVLKRDSMIVNVRNLATVLGQIISLTPCVGGEFPSSLWGMLHRPRGRSCNILLFARLNCFVVVLICLFCGPITLHGVRNGFKRTMTSFRV